MQKQIPQQQLEQMMREGQRAQGMLANDAAKSAASIEMTPEMIQAASDELMANLSDYVPRSWGLAERVAQRILEAALARLPRIEECNFSTARPNEPLE